MLCALTVRRLRPGAYEDFMRAWQDVEHPADGWVRAYTIRSLANENEVISFGFFDGSLEELHASQAAMDYAAWREATDELVEWTGTDGIFEVVSQHGA
jgi:hypothetical protein